MNYLANPIVKRDFGVGSSLTVWRRYGKEKKTNHKKQTKELYKKCAGPFIVEAANLTPQCKKFWCLKEQDSVCGKYFTYVKQIKDT